MFYTELIVLQLKYISSKEEFYLTKHFHRNVKHIHTKTGSGILTSLT